MSNNLTITHTLGYHECGDGCCQDDIDYIVIKRGTEEVYRHDGDIYPEHLGDILKKLGFKIQLYTDDKQKVLHACEEKTVSNELIPSIQFAISELSSAKCEIENYEEELSSARVEIEPAKTHIRTLIREKQEVRQ